MQYESLIVFFPAGCVACVKNLFTDLPQQSLDTYGYSPLALRLPMQTWQTCVFCHRRRVLYRIPGTPGEIDPVRNRKEDSNARNSIRIEGSWSGGSLRIDLCMQGVDSNIDKYLRLGACEARTSICCFVIAKSDSSLRVLNTSMPSGGVGNHIKLLEYSSTVYNPDSCSFYSHHTIIYSTALGYVQPFIESG